MAKVLEMLGGEGQPAAYSGMVLVSRVGVVSVQSSNQGQPRIDCGWLAGQVLTGWLLVLRLAGIGKHALDLALEGIVTLLLEVTAFVGSS